ncbi:putative bifunctional diguanylate cyclase/phosphodiesterase [Pengzhenrongella frigida]|uniref:EAL domain-containing protein n=1 Tax=Pengzhenrongella frigida TaxID=1259133 RepID=A0A4Q5N852_9MICO|nr:EAL domain-containing protein [Cellulomonas sp. HLT2-17]RYV52881.1 EAL domain-containing protein [Cellulomonas sp. HLT2-17]
MESGAGLVAVVAQCAMAGFIGGLCFQHWTAWHDDRGNRGAFWLMLWSAALALLFGVNAVQPALPAGPVDEAALFVRAQLLAAAILLAMPAIRDFTRGRPIRGHLLVAGALFGVRAVLWFTTDLVYTHTAVEGVPQYGPLVAITFFVPAAVVFWYGVVSTMRMPSVRTRYGLQVAGALSIAGLLVSFLLPNGRIAELSTSVWALPLVAYLQAMRILRIRAADAKVLHQHRLRESLADVGRAAWSTSDRLELLELAQTTARRQIGDDSITGSMSALPGGRFSTSFTCPPELLADPSTRDFLDDLSEIVATATERMRLAANLSAAAFTDALTRLPNRHALELHLVHALARAAAAGTRLAVLYCDIDGFKQENDQHGHSWGDELLRRTAGHVRAGPSENHFAARFGGDEFVVVQEDIRSRDGLLALAHRIRTDLDLTGTDQIAPLISVGVAFWEPGDSTGPEELLRQADTAMFEGKRSRVGVVVFDDALRARMRADQNLRRELTDALAGGEFEMYYQAIVDAATLEVVGTEALVRWHHPDGLRMPGYWLGFAEETGLIVPIGRHLVRAARAGAHRLGLPVAVNVAARQLAEPGYVRALREDWGEGDWHLLTLEITESALLQDLAQVIDSLITLRALGVRISIDDFGTGYSSFARLAVLPVDVLKIDQAFVRDLDEPGGVAVVQAIVSLAKAHGLDVVAEGVERIDQFETLVDLGVHKLQGFLIGRPTSAASLPVELTAASFGRVVESRTRRESSA